MANLFFTLPVPAFNGVGASVDTSAAGQEKTIQVDGVFKGAINIEISQDAGVSWATIATFTAEGKRVIPVAAGLMRVNRLGAPPIAPGLPVVDVSANDDGGLFVPVPVAPGTANIEALGNFKTVTVFGTTKPVNIEVSDDGVNWVNCMTFARPGVQSKVFTSKFIRSNSDSAIVAVGGVNEGAGSSIASNVLLEPVSPAVAVRIYVRTTGDDTTGDGTLGNPYRTVRHALSTVPVFIVGEQYIIDCTDIGQEISNDVLNIGPFSSPDTYVYFGPNATYPFFVTAPLTIEASPTILHTLNVGDITGSTTQATSGLRTYITNQNYALDELKGKTLIDATGNAYGVIASNTAGPNSELRVTMRTAHGSLVAPVIITEPSAEIVNGSGDFARAVSVTTQCPVVLNGIKFSSANPSVFNASIRIHGSIESNLTMQFCEITGMSLTSASYPVFDGCYFHAKTLSANESGFFIDSCFFEAMAFVLRQHLGGSPSDVRECIFDGTQTVIGNTGVDDTSFASYFTQNCEIVGVTNSLGAMFAGPGVLLRAQNVLISGCVGNAVTVVNTRAVLQNVQGTGNTGIGVEVRSGGTVVRTGGTAVTGTGGDYKVGGDAATAGGGVGWAAFSGNETDLAAAAPQLCRIGTV